MLEILILLSAVAIIFLITLLKSLQFAPSGLSQSELNRRKGEGNKSAAQELKRRDLLPIFNGIVQLKIIALNVALAGLLLATHPLWLALIMIFVLLTLAQVVVAKGLLANLGQLIARKTELLAKDYVKKVKLLSGLVPPIGHFDIRLNSKSELRQLIEEDSSVMSPVEKTRLLASFDFGDKKIADFMVNHQQIKTVKIDETIGPLLLDKLHKLGHNIYPVVDKDLDNIKGFLYMSDLVPLDPELKEIKQVLRPKIHYLADDDKLEEVIKASLKTGRQLFLVKSKQTIVGLITLADALAQLNGQQFAKS